MVMTQCANTYLRSAIESKESKEENESSHSSQGNRMSLHVHANSFLSGQEAADPRAKERCTNKSRCSAQKVDDPAPSKITIWNVDCFVVVTDVDSSTQPALWTPGPVGHNWIDKPCMKTLHEKEGMEFFQPYLQIFHSRSSEITNKPLPAGCDMNNVDWAWYSRRATLLISDPMLPRGYLLQICLFTGDYKAVCDISKEFTSFGHCAAHDGRRGRSKHKVKEKQWILRIHHTRCSPIFCTWK